MFIKLLNLIITKLEHKSEGTEKELFQKILNSIDLYNFNKYGIRVFRLYNICEFKVEKEDEECNI